MGSKRVTQLFLAVLMAMSFAWCLPFAGAQSTSNVAQRTSPATQLFLQQKTKVEDLLRGPVSPGQLALKAAHGNASKYRPFGANPSSLTNAIFTAALDYDTVGYDTVSVAAAVLIAHGNVDLVTADNCNNSNNCTNGGISVLLGNGDGTFLPPVSYNSGGQSAQAVVLVDVNGDGILDAIVANDCNTNNCNSGEVSVLLGNGDGTFQSAVSYNSAGYDTISVAVADVNADGKPDIILADQCNNNNCSNGQVSVLLGNGDGTFQTAVGYGSGGQNAQVVAIADVNGDGKPDLEVTNWCVNSNCANGSVSILLGNGDGTFQTAVSYNTIGIASSSVAVADVNGDGKPDLAVSNECSGNNCANGVVNIFLGNGDGTFQAAVGYNSGGLDANSIVLTDLNGNGKLDVVVANQVDNEGNYQDGGVASVLMGNGDGTFQTAVAYTTGNQGGLGLAVADVNGDGSPDVMMASPCANNYSCNSGAVGVLLGNGNGTLQGGVNYSSGAWVSSGVTIADVNGDGKPDLLLANQCNNNSNCTNGTASVLLGNGDGTFQTAVDYSSGGQNAFSVVASDLSGNGHLDLVLANQCADNNCSNGVVAVLLGNGDGTFQTAVTYGSGGLYTYSLAVADVNGDGIPDIVAANNCKNNNCTNGEVSVLLGNGDGTFQTAVSYNSAGVTTLSVAVADVNGDGHPDIVLADQCNNSNNCTSGQISVLLGNGDGTFQTAVGYSSGGVNASAVAIGDVNGNGSPDLVVANACVSDSNCSNGSIAVLLGNGDGTFQTASTTTTPSPGYNETIVLADVNGDHNLDVVSGGGNMLLLGNGDGTFQTPIALGAGGIGTAVGDLNGDGRPDLAVGGVTVLLNVSSGFVFPTTTTVASTLNPATFGSSITFTATVAAQVTGIPTGTITFSDGSTTLGTETLTSGSASCTTSSLAVGTHSITATYSGGTGFTGSVSTVLSEVVAQESTTTTLTASGTTPGANQSVTFTATVKSGTSIVPAGTVSFLDGTTQIGSSSLNGSGVATFSTAALAAGTHSITAVYGGSSNFAGSTSGAASVVVTSAGFSLTSVALTPASVKPGGSAESTITVTPTGGLNPSSVKLTCTVTPVANPAVACSLGSMTVTGGAGSAKLTVSTGGTQAALSEPAHGSGRLILALMIPGMFLCGAGIRKPNRRKLLAMGWVFLVLTGCMLQMACGGYSPESSSSDSQTPAGTYTVKVTGSVSGAQQSTTSVSLTVQ